MTTLHLEGWASCVHTAMGVPPHPMGAIGHENTIDANPQTSRTATPETTPKPQPHTQRQFFRNAGTTSKKPF